MFIQTDTTPNPSTLKFLPGQTVMGISPAIEFTDSQTAQQSPLASRIFTIKGVKTVFLGSDFIAVAKEDATEWAHIKPSILAAIMDHYLSGNPVLNKDANQTTKIDPPLSDADNAIVAQIKDLLDTRIRPAVAQDGGDITFHNFTNGIVYLHMRGACAGCPSSTMTLKAGIENLLKHYIPEVVEVQAIS